MSSRVAAIEKPVSRQEPRRLKTRAALLAAGLKLLADRPIDGVSIDDIVQRAGVAKGSFFNHFADKDDFASAIADDIRAGVEETVTRANRDVTDPAERVIRGICCFVAFALAEKSAAKIFLRTRAATAVADHSLNEGVRSDLAKGLAENRFAQTAPEAGLAYILGVAQGLLASVIHQRLTADKARSLSIAVLTLLLTGLAIDPDEANRIATDAARSLIV